MTIYKFLPKRNYTKFDNRVLMTTTDRLADGAKVMYMYLAHHMTGKKITHAYIRKALNVSQTSLEKYVRQLKELDLILMDRVGTKQYDCYIGSTEVPASNVKRMWRELDAEDADNPYTAEDISKMQQKYKEEEEED